MCVVSMISDSLNPIDVSPPWIDKSNNIIAPLIPNIITKANDEDFPNPEEFAIIIEIAKVFDEDTGQPDCEDEEKMTGIKAIFGALPDISLTNVPESFVKFTKMYLQKAVDSGESITIDDLKMLTKFLRESKEK